MKDQTTSSITLSWTEPDGPDHRNYTYWVQWTGADGKAENKSTTNTSVLVDGLQPGSLYEFAVWVQINGTSSSKETCNATTGERQLPLLFFLFILREVIGGGGESTEQRSGLSSPPSPQVTLSRDEERTSQVLSWGRSGSRTL